MCDNDVPLDIVAPMTTRFVASALSQVGYSLLTPPEFAQTLAVDLSALEPLRRSWSDLPKDAYLRDGGNYRSRRHSCFVQQLPNGIVEAPHRAHWQSTDYNALHGGIERWFEPISPAVRTDPHWLKLLVGFGEIFATLRATQRWFIEAHQFRIDTAEGIGRPTPEGAHRDGVDFVVVLLIERRDVRGGETRVFQARGSAGVRFTMTEPWTALLLNDAEVIHETTPIQPEVMPGVRDTLVITYRADGFQQPAVQ
jgi:hypothetical protein